MANHRSSMRRSKSFSSLIPRITTTRPSDEGPRSSISSVQPKSRFAFAPETKVRRTNSSTSLRGSNADVARPSSVSRLSKQPTTPLSLHQKTPLRQSSVKKDTRPVNDKKWQTDQHLKVKGFFADKPTIVNNLKPMTIQSFVDAMDALFSCIDDRICVNAANYKEQVPMCMKYLGYPATISASLLKCVNTIHTWPQVIAMLSWLVDFVNYICYSTAPIEYIHERSELHEPIEKYLLQRYIAWNQGRSEEEVDRQFKSELYELYGFNEKQYLEFEKKVQTLEPQLAKHKQTDDELSKKIAAIKKEIQTKQEEINAFRNERKVPVEEKRQQWFEQIDRIDKAIAEKRENIAELNAIISKQPCTLEEFEAKKQDTIVLKHNLQLQKEKVDKWIEIISDCDYKLTDTKQKLHRAILDQNLAVMKWEHLNPEMKNLEIQITGYAQIKNEIARVTQLREDYYRKFITELNEARKKLEDTVATHKLLKKKTEVLKDDAEKSKQLQDKLDVEVDQYELETDDEIKLLLKRQETLTEENTSLVKQKLELSKQTEVLQEDIATEDKEIKDENANRIEMQKETLNFFVHLHNSIMQNFMKLYELKQGVQSKVKEVMQKKEEDRLKSLQLVEELAKDLSD